MKYIKIYDKFTSFKRVNESEEQEIFNQDEVKTDSEGLEESQFGPEEVLVRWKDKFGEEEPSTQDKYDFYSDLREEGFDGIVIFDTLADKFNNDSESQDDDCQICTGTGVDSEDSKCLNCDGTGKCESCDSQKSIEPNQE